MKKVCLALAAVLFASWLSLAVTTRAEAPADARCAALRSGAQAVRFANIPDAPTTINSTQTVAAKGALPAHCRVLGTIAPNVGFEIRLPTADWNGKLMMKGCGGPCGNLPSESADPALAKRYATVVTDMGHQSQGWMFAYNNLPATIDFAYRSTHVTAVAAKELVAAFYGTRANRNYYMGCSTGGRQGMVEAQRFPTDFEGIIAGSPPWNQTGVRSNYLLWNARANVGADGKAILTEAKVAMIHQAVLDACDALDGVRDGLLQDPRQCHWRPEQIACAAGTAGAGCLTPAEVGVVTKIYSGATDSRGRHLFFGMPRGSEYNWVPFSVSKDGKPSGNYGDDGSVGNSSLNYMAFFYPPGPGYKNTDFDYDRDPQRLALTEYLFNAQNPDLSAYKATGGKLILYHGWDDEQIPAASSVDYYETATRTMGGPASTRDFFRLFLLPNGRHCFGGRGASEVDWIEALENWVEKGRAPERVVGYRTRDAFLPRPIFPLKPGEYDLSRPIYPYPALAAFTGRGNPADAANWVERRR